FPRGRGLKTRLECSPASRRALARADYDLARGIPTDLTLLRDREADLLVLEKALRDDPKRVAGDRYRKLAMDGDDPDRAIRFFQGLLAERPQSADLRLQLALAYVDRTPDPELGSVRKGLYSSEALKLLEAARAAHPDSWGLHYAVGLIHLNWFTKLKHVPFAMEAFEGCLALQKGREREKP